MATVEPFGLSPEEIIELYNSERKSGFEKRLQNNPTDSTAKKHEMLEDAETEALLRIFMKNNHHFSEGVYLAIEDYFFNKFKVDELSNRITALENRLTRFEQNQNAK